MIRLAGCCLFMKRTFKTGAEHISSQRRNKSVQTELQYSHLLIVYMLLLKRSCSCVAKCTFSRKQICSLSEAVIDCNVLQTLCWDWRRSDLYIWTQVSDHSISHNVRKWKMWYVLQFDSDSCSQYCSKKRIRPWGSLKVLCFSLPCKLQRWLSLKPVCPGPAQSGGTSFHFGGLVKAIL